MRDVGFGILLGVDLERVGWCELEDMGRRIWRPGEG